MAPERRDWRADPFALGPCVGCGGPVRAGWLSRHEGCWPPAPLTPGHSATYDITRTLGGGARYVCRGCGRVILAIAGDPWPDAALEEHAAAHQLVAVAA